MDLPHSRKYIQVPWASEEEGVWPESRRAALGIPAISLGVPVTIPLAALSSHPSKSKAERLILSGLNRNPIPYSFMLVENEEKSEST